MGIQASGLGTIVIQGADICSLLGRCFVPWFLLLSLVPDCGSFVLSDKEWF